MTDEVSNPGNQPEGTPPGEASLKAEQEPWYKAGGFDDAHQKVLSKYKSPEEAHKALVAAQPLIHGKIVMPKDDATPDEKAKFRRSIMAKLGAPEKADDYKLDECIPELIRQNPHYADYKGKVEQILLEEKIDPGVFRRLFDASNEMSAILGQDYEKSKTEGIKALRTTVGGGDAEWKAYLEQAGAAAIKFGSEGLAKLIAEEENPALIAAMHTLWDHTLREGTTKTGGEPPKLPDTGAKPALFSDDWYGKPEKEAKG